MRLGLGHSLISRRRIPVVISGSRALDEAALQDLFVSTNGATWTTSTGWASTGMNLDNTIHGVTTALIGGEQRVTEINLKENNLTGNINNATMGNLTQMTYFNVHYNTITGALPASLGDIGPGLDYIYLNVSDDIEGKVDDPHENILTGDNDFHPGKEPSIVNDVKWNDFSGAIPTEWSALRPKWLTLDWCSITTIPDVIFQNWNPEGFHFHVIEDFTPAVMFDLSNFSNISHITFGQEDNVGRDKLTGSWSDLSPANKTALKYIRLDGQKLSGAFADLSNSVNLRGFFSAFNDDYGGGAFPAFFVDGTMPNITSIDCTFPTSGGWSGAFPEVVVTTIKTLNLIGHDLTSLPASFWNSCTSLIVNDFRDNQLTTIGTTDLTANTNLRNLRWNGNNVSENWPNLAWGSISSFTTAEFADNKYLFKHMLYVPANAPAGETIFELYAQNATVNFDYAPQKNFGTAAEYTEVDVNGDIVLDDFATLLTHVDNVYQWKKNGVNISDGATGNGSTYSGATTDTLTITGAVEADDGAYTLVVTNTTHSGLVTTYSLADGDLTLTSNALTVSLGNSPVVEETLTQQFTGPTTTFGVNMSVTVNSGDRLVLIATAGKNSTMNIATPTGWTRGNQVLDNQTQSVVFTRTADGTEGGTTVNLSLSASGAGCTTLYRVSSGNNIETSTWLDGTVTSSPSPPSLTPSWGAKSTLWIAVSACNDDDASFTAAPANYTGLTSVASGAGVNAGNEIGTAYRQLNATSEDPGSFTLSENENAQSLTIAVEPAP